MAPKIEKVVEDIEFGEGPHWDEDTQSLYFIDMKRGTVNRYVPATNKHTKADLGRSHVSVVIPVKGEKDKFLVSSEREILIVTWDGESDKASEITKVFDLDVGEVKFNDGKCDPSGRLWIGTMGLLVKKGDTTENPDIGSFYSFQGNNIRTHFDKVRVSNGLAFNVQLKKFYHIDTFKDTIDEFDFDIEKGTLANRKPIFTPKKHDLPSNGIPDGMTIDTEGNLWIALARASQVIKVDPRKPETLLDSVVLPSKMVTSVAFGGTNLDELYVTTGTSRDEEEVDTGSIYKITGLNAKGYPGVRVIL